MQIRENMFWHSWESSAKLLSRRFMKKFRDPLSLKNKHKGRENKYKGRKKGHTTGQSEVSNPRRLRPQRLAIQTGSTGPLNTVDWAVKLQINRRFKQLLKLI